MTALSKPLSSLSSILLSDHFFDRAMESAKPAIVMLLTTCWLNRSRLSGSFMFPNLVLLALVAIYTVIIGTFVVPT